MFRIWILVVRSIPKTITVTPSNSDIFFCPVCVCVYIYIYICTTANITAQKEEFLLANIFFFLCLSLGLSFRKEMISFYTPSSSHCASMQDPICRKINIICSLDSSQDKLLSLSLSLSRIILEVYSICVWELVCLNESHNPSQHTSSYIIIATLYISQFVLMCVCVCAQIWENKIFIRMCVSIYIYIYILQGLPNIAWVESIIYITV